VFPHSFAISTELKRGGTVYNFFGKQCIRDSNSDTAIWAKVPPQVKLCFTLLATNHPFLLDTTAQLRDCGLVPHEIARI
jgi:hypothetical protein